MNNKKENKMNITAEQVEQVLDHARTLAEKDEYDFAYSMFNTQDMAYIEKAIDMLKQQKNNG